jgi:hypothetical protein
MTKINSRTSSESNEGFLQRVPHIFGFVISDFFRHSSFVLRRHWRKEILQLRKSFGLGMTQRPGACIINTAIMLPRNTSRTSAKPIKIPLRTGSLCCFWRRYGETLVKSAGAALNSAGLALISSSWGSGRDPLVSPS